MNPKLDPPQTRRLLPDSVAERIQARILDGTFKPGDRLPPERELAEQLQVNRSSVREALKKLEQLRLIVIQQGSGIRVQSPEEGSFELVWAMLFQGDKPNVPRIREFFELRDALLPGMLKLAMERATAPQIEDAVRRLDRLAQPDLPDIEFMDGLRDMQDLVAQMTHNQVLIILTNSLLRYMKHTGFRQITLASPEERQALVPFIRRLAVALEARDSDSARRGLNELMRRFSQGLIDRLEAIVAAMKRADDNANA